MFFIVSITVKCEITFNFTNIIRQQRLPSLRFTQLVLTVTEIKLNAVLLQNNLTAKSMLHDLPQRIKFVQLSRVVDLQTSEHFKDFSSMLV